MRIVPKFTAQDSCAEGSAGMLSMPSIDRGRVAILFMLRRKQ